ncbi:MAG: type II toxin-antitoxin system RelE/ParE family toxin [Treponema sp.]|nr:type II toxin-antitoxin system RelE/ParE family toxin [Treponema sp.]
MIQYSVEFTRAAREDYINLCSYEISHPAISIEKIQIAITSLEVMPERHPFFEEEKFTVEKEIRVMREDNILIFYYINKEEKIVSIIRMMYIQDVAVTQQLVTQ